MRHVDLPRPGLVERDLVFVEPRRVASVAGKILRDLAARARDLDPHVGVADGLVDRIEETGREPDRLADLGRGLEPRDLRAIGLQPRIRSDGADGVAPKLAEVILAISRPHHLPAPRRVGGQPEHLAAADVLQRDHGHRALGKLPHREQAGARLDRADAVVAVERGQVVPGVAIGGRIRLELHDGMAEASGGRGDAERLVDLRLLGGLDLKRGEPGEGGILILAGGVDAAAAEHDESAAAAADEVGEPLHLRLRRVAPLAEIGPRNVAENDDVVFAEIGLGARQAVAGVLVVHRALRVPAALGQHRQEGGLDHRIAGDPLPEDLPLVARDVEIENADLRIEHADLMLRHLEAFADGVAHAVDHHAIRLLPRLVGLDDERDLDRLVAERHVFPHRDRIGLALLHELHGDVLLAELVGGDRGGDPQLVAEANVARPAVDPDPREPGRGFGAEHHREHRQRPGGEQRGEQLAAVAGGVVAVGQGDNSPQVVFRAGGFGDRFDKAGRTVWLRGGIGWLQFPIEVVKDHVGLGADRPQQLISELPGGGKPSLAADVLEPHAGGGVGQHRDGGPQAAFDGEAGLQLTEHEQDQGEPRDPHHREQKPRRPRRDRLRQEIEGRQRQAERRDQDDGPERQGRVGPPRPVAHASDRSGCVDSQEPIDRRHACASLARIFSRRAFRR